MPLVPLAGICLASFALCAWWLERQSFWLDEGFSAALSAGPLWYIVQQSFTKEPNPPFYFLLLHLWRLPAGSTEYAIRFLSVCPTVATMPLLYGLGRRLGGKRLSLLAASLGAVNPYLVWLAQEARMYAWALLWTTLGAYLLLRALGSGRRSDWLWCALANLLAVYTHLYAVFVVGAEGVFLLWRLIAPNAKAYRRNTVAGLVSVAAPAALFVPWFVSITTYAGETSTWRGFIGVWDMLRVLGLNFASQAHLGNLGVGAIAARGVSVDDGFAIVLAVAAIAGAVLLRRPGYAIVWLVLPIAAVYALSFKEPLFSPRYFIVVLPAFLLLAAGGLAALPRTGMAAALALLSAGSVWAIERGNTVAAYGKEDYRLAASYVGQRSEPGDVIGLIANYIVYPFTYYFHGAGQVLPLDIDPNSDVDTLLAPLSQHDHIWLVEAHDVFVDPNDRAGKWLRDRYHVADEKYITGIHFIEFDPHPTVPSLPPSAKPIDGTFPSGPTLAGYDVAPGPLTHVTLFWHAQPQSQAFHISLKLWRPDGQLGAQQDGEPLNAGLPFTKFPTTGFVRDEHFLQAPPGVYDLRLSVYLPGQPDLGQLDLGPVRV